MVDKAKLPKYDDLFSPTLQVLMKLGGSGSIEEINDNYAVTVTGGGLNGAMTESG